MNIVNVFIIVLFSIIITFGIRSHLKFKDLLFILILGVIFLGVGITYMSILHGYESVDDALLLKKMDVDYLFMMYGYLFITAACLTFIKQKTLVSGKKQRISGPVV